MRAPRGLALLPDGDIIVADMGGWQADRGRIWLIRFVAGRYEKTALFDHLDRPSSVAVAPDGSVFVGMVKRIVRFDPRSPKPVLADVIGGASIVPALPGSGRHLLPSLLFDSSGNLFVNLGSGSDHCEDEDGQMRADARCVEREGNMARAVIRKYTLQWPAGTIQGWAVYARGLRNSMAMAFDRDGSLWQGENGRDAINAAIPGLSNDDELPHDELNLVERGADYGWPYCYDDNRSSPEYPKANCPTYRAPRRLLPAHAAPLDMTFYAGRAYPPRYNGSLVITYHGYRKHGHRIVALLPDGSGAPFGKSVDLVIGSRQKGKGFGAPVGVSLGNDGKLYLADDHDGTVARLSYEGAAH
jgi:glucose/arabinose dehydrogenase